MSAHSQHGLLGPTLLGFGSGLLSQGFSELPQTGFEPFGRGFQQAAKFQNIAQDRQIKQGALQQRADQNAITNNFAQQRLNIAQDRALQGTALQRNLAVAFDPKTSPEMRQAILAGTKTGTDIQIINKGRAAGSEAMFKSTSKGFADAQSAAGDAQIRNRQNALISSFLQNDDLFTGTGGVFVQKMKQLAQVAGVDVQGVADGELLEVFGRRAAVRLQEIGQLDLGRLTKEDLDVLFGLTPSLFKSPEANRRLILIDSEVDRLKIQKSTIFQKFLNPNTGEVSPAVWAEIAKADAESTRRVSRHIASLRALSSQAGPKSIFVGTPINTMTNKQLDALNPETMTPDELRQADRRFKRLGR